MYEYKFKILSNIIILFTISLLCLDFISSQTIFLEFPSISNELTQIDISNLSSSDILSSTNNCTISNCPPGRGICVEDKCLCAYGYVTFNKSENHAQIFCNYKQKSRLTAFFLEFFFPIGIGHAYAGKVYLAIIKFSLFLILVCGTCGELCCIGIENNKGVICSAILILFVLLFWLAMCFFDLFAYAFGYYTDGNGILMI